MSARFDVLHAGDLIVPDWPAPPRVKALFTTRAGGVSSGGYASLNLGAHVGDAIEDVAENRRRLRELLPSSPAWLDQVHGACVMQAEDVMSRESGARAIEADASVTAQPRLPCAVLVADCLPVLFCTTDGSRVGVAHAGWRGLQRGVLERTVEAMQVEPATLMAWLGPAIGPNAFEVGRDVVEAFTSVADEDVRAFRAIPDRHDKYLGDLYALARRRLHEAGVRQFFGGQFCTVSEPARFFSYRRDGKTGRMAALIWLE